MLTFFFNVLKYISSWNSTERGYYMSLKTDLGYNGNNPEAPWTIYKRDAEWSIVEQKQELTLVEAIEHLGYEVFVTACRHLRAWDQHLKQSARLITRMDRDDARAQIQALATQIEEAVQVHGYPVPGYVSDRVAEGADRVQMSA